MTAAGGWNPVRVVRRWWARSGWNARFTVFVEFTRFRLEFEYGYLRRTAVSAFLFFLAFLALLVGGFLTSTPDLGHVRYFITQRRVVEAPPLQKVLPGGKRMSVPRAPKVERHVLRPYTPGFVGHRHVPWYLVGALVVAEDSLFFQHRGMDWDEMRAAVHDWIFGGQSLRGASTLTQQLVKNAWLYRDRTPLRKLRELIIAHRLEGALRKEEILDYYLNIAEWGPDSWGIRAASRLYFHAEPHALAPEQAALLTYFLPAPRKRGGTYLRGEPDFRREAHVRWVLWQMQAQGYWSPPVKVAPAKEEREPDPTTDMP